jgi:hypothetical protein
MNVIIAGRYICDGIMLDRIRAEEKPENSWKVVKARSD